MSGVLSYSQASPEVNLINIMVFISFRTCATSALNTPQPQHLQKRTIYPSQGKILLQTLQEKTAGVTIYPSKGKILLQTLQGLQFNQQAAENGIN